MHAIIDCPLVARRTLSRVLLLPYFVPPLSSLSFPFRNNVQEALGIIVLVVPGRIVYEMNDSIVELSKNVLVYLYDLRDNFALSGQIRSNEVTYYPVSSVSSNPAFRLNEPLAWNDVPRRFSCREFFLPNCNIFSVYKYI